MGYYMTQGETDFRMKKENFEAALNALKEYFRNKGDRSWIWAQSVINANTFEEAMDGCRWGIEIDDDGDCWSIGFNGEKYGDDEAVFNVIAPYVENESYIIMSGEDGWIWRWYFDGEKCREQNAQITWVD